MHVPKGLAAMVSFTAQLVSRGRWVKKDTKKKGKAVVEESHKVEEPVKAPELEPEDDMGWANAWGKKDKKKGKNMPIEITDETPAPDSVSVPANDAEDDWGTWGTSKKDKAPPPTPTPPTPPEIESVSDPVKDPKQDELPAASPLPSPSPFASESVWHPISANISSSSYKKYD